MLMEGTTKVKLTMPPEAMVLRCHLGLEHRYLEFLVDKAHLGNPTLCPSGSLLVTVARLWSDSLRAEGSVTTHPVLQRGQQPR